MTDLTIIIPTLNEAKSIRKTINLVEEFVDRDTTEILIVDDNSTDGTLDVVRDLTAIYPNIHLLVRLTDHGLSNSLVDGFYYAASPVLMVMDSDGQHPPRYIKPLYQQILDGNDIAIASRYMKGGGVWYVPWYRKLLSWGATYLARFFFPTITDSGSGFFAFKKEVIKDAPLQPQGFRMLFEVLGKGKWASAKEIPYTLQVRENGQSKLKASTVLSYLKQLWNLLLYSLSVYSSHGHREIVRVITFGVVGITGIIVNLGITYTLSEIGGLWYMYAAVVGIETSILTNFILNDTITFWDTTNKNPALKRLGLYHIACLGGVAITITTLFIGVRLNMYYMLALFIGICLAFLWNFSFSRGIAWKE